MPKGSILVVDDEIEIREGLEALLTSENFQVTLADTGAAGLQKLEDNPFDLMLLDVSLPDRNGLELLREIRLRDPQICKSGMRSSDGEHFTDAGYRYVWQKVRRDSTFAAEVEWPRRTPFIEASTAPRPRTKTVRTRHRSRAMEED